MFCTLRSRATILSHVAVSFEAAVLHTGCTACGAMEMGLLAAMLPQARECSASVMNRTVRDLEASKATLRLAPLRCVLHCLWCADATIVRPVKSFTC